MRCHDHCGGVNRCATLLGFHNTWNHHAVPYTDYNESYNDAAFNHNNIITFYNCSTTPFGVDMSSGERKRSPGIPSGD
jgi:hypothetical protein